MKNLFVASLLAFSFCFVCSGCDKASTGGDEVIKEKADETELKPQAGNQQKAPSM